MLFPRRFWSGIADGSVTIAFRRWKRLQVTPGKPNRTPGGIVIIDSVEVVTPAEINEHDARSAGFATPDEVRASLAPDESLPIYRIAFHLAPGPDPRATLADAATLTAEDVAGINRRLERLDRVSSTGPWTRATLALIAANPAVRAGDLAPALGMDLQPFKLNVRKLKNLGLTISLGTGYRLSPRGATYMASRPGSE